MKIPAQEYDVSFYFLDIFILINKDIIFCVIILHIMLN